MTDFPRLTDEQIEVLKRASKRDGLAPTYRACGVSQSTFSRALTGEQCALSTYEKMAELAKKLTVRERYGTYLTPVAEMPGPLTGHVDKLPDEGT